MADKKERIFLTGVACVGKSTIGKQLSIVLQMPFYDLDREVEKYFCTSIEKLQNRFLTLNSFRSHAAKVLSHILSTPESLRCVIALPPSGLMGAYYRAIRKFGGTTIVPMDTPENILKRIIFYDIDSKPLHVALTKLQKIQYLRGIKADIKYFNTFYKKADRKVDISGLPVEESVRKIEALIQ